MDTVSVVKRFRGDYEFLSNFYPAKQMYDGIAYYNAEAAYQAQKCADPDPKMHFAKLYSDESKRFGRTIVVREDWDEIKVDVMKQVVRAKFEQNPRLAKMLLGTGDIPLREGNTWHDVFWGVDLKTGEGENHLGQILMQLRKEFKEKGFDDKSALRPIQEYHYGQHMILTDEAMADVEVECIVKELDNKTFPDLNPGCAMLQDIDSIRSIIVQAPVYGKNDEQCLAECYKNSLEIAATLNMKSIAFPAISVGKKCFPKQRAAEIAITTVTDWIAHNSAMEMTLYLVPEDARVFHYMLEKLFAMIPNGDF